MRAIALLFLWLCCAFPAWAATIVAATGAAGNWTAGSAWIGGVAPTAADSAQITVATTSITIDAGALCRGADFAGFTGTITAGATGTLAIGDGTAALSNIALNLPSGATCVPNAAFLITFKSTSATQQTILTGGYTYGIVTINGAGSSYILSDNLTMAGTFTYTAGTTFDTTTGSRVITLNGASKTFAGGAKTYYSLKLTGSGQASISGANTFTLLERTGTAAKFDTLRLLANQTVSSGGTLTLAGADGINRLLVFSDTIGTARTITNSGATMTWSYVDFMDISLGTSYNASAITGGSGNALGNTNITFTTAISPLYWQGTSGGSWNVAANWNSTEGGGGTSRIPLPQDDVMIRAAFTASQTVTMNMVRLCANLDTTGVTGSPVLSNNTGGTQGMYGNLTVSTAINSTSFGIGYNFQFYGRGAAQTITSGGFVFAGAAAAEFYAFGGKYTLADAYSGARSIFLGNGELAALGNVTIESLENTSAATRTLTMGPGTWTITGTGGGNMFRSTSAALTLSAASSTINFTDTTATAKTFFNGTNLTWGNVTFTGKNIVLTFTTGITFATIALNNLGDTTGVTFPASKTVTCTGFTTTASSGNVAKLISSSAGSAATISKSSGTVSINWCSIKDSAATGGATFYAGANSTNVSGNSGWIFTAPPSGNTGAFFEVFASSQP